MIQNIEPHVYRNEYVPEPPKEDSVILYYEGRKILVKIEDQEISFLTFKEAAVYNPDVYEEYTYLFSIDGQGYYLAEGIDPENFPGFELKDNQYFREARPKYRQFAAVTGWQLYRWYQSRKFCGHCGQPMVHDDKERMMRCPDCGMMEFPKICPAVIIAVTHGDKILMSKYAGREYKKYALLAGFNETGESIEETVRREVMEEVGLKVKNLRYYKSQPWSFTDTLLMGFFCELDGEDGITLDTDELAMAEWFEREQMPVEAVHCGVDDGINVVDQVLAVALCLIVSSHTLVSHDLAIQVVDLGVQLGDALITALVLADLVVQIHAGQIELSDEILQFLILVVCLAGLIQSQVTGVSLQCHGGALEQIDAIHNQKSPLMCLFL